MVSVIIPYYNSGSTIYRAVKSAIDQTYPDLEIIIVDDASQDSHVLDDIVARIGDKRIKCIRHDKNRNGSAARNTGVKKSSGEFIAFLDSDDEWFPDHIARSIEALNAENNLVVYCKNLVKTGIHADLVMPQSGIQYNEKVSEYLFCGSGYISTPSLIAPAHIFKEHLFDETLIRHQDYELLLRLDALKYKFLLSDHIGVVVHWENYDTEKKGGTHNFSQKFAEKYRHLFSPKAYSCFVFKNVIVPLLIKKQRMKALRLFIVSGNPFRLGFKKWAFFIDYFIWGKLTVIKFIVGE